MPAIVTTRVKSLQQALVDGGQAIRVDGVMGMQTYRAAIRAQNGAATKGKAAEKPKTPENGSDWLTAPVAQKSRLIERIVIHCSATPPAMYVDIETIKTWHLQRGFNDVGYHYVICRDGELQAGRKEHRTGAHVKGHNARSIGICLVGGARKRNGRLVAENNFTVKQWSTLAQVLREMKEKYPQAVIVGHRDLAATSCPGFHVQGWLDEFL